MVRKKENTAQAKQYQKPGNDESDNGSNRKAKPPRRHHGSHGTGAVGAD